MRRHHRGSGRRSVIPTDWQDHHAAVVDQAMLDAECTVTIGPETGGAAVFNPTLGYSETPVGTAIYTGSAMVSVFMPRDHRAAVAEDEVTWLQYRVTLPVDVAGLSTGHVVRVVSSTDADLVGKTLAVADFERGARRFSRVLIATLND
jgi:hypothetical protein